MHDARTDRYITIPIWVAWIVLAIVGYILSDMFLVPKLFPKPNAHVNRAGETE